MTIKLDSTRISTVVKCSECPWWAAFADSKLEGWTVGARHDSLVHGGSKQSTDALSWTKQHAE
ncbi:hypothetical protein EV379_0904 [Microterricola gilva]|uniref:Uncharacterized protein n=1 Tax=Microterricola gilva TaxID=393267 RepID=A0A4Q8AKN6_9MICO|nr:hypothetical protein [Microterricola gilva]RZU64601.1 hypothetical protein EV379_0904 [Microterricola gilva]